MRVGWWAEDHLCNEDEHEWEGVSAFQSSQPVREICTRCSVSRRLVPESVFEKNKRVLEHEMRFLPILSGAAGGISVTLHGGRANGRTITLSDTPPTITAYGEPYEQIRDPDTGEFLGGYAAVAMEKKPCVACRGRGQAHGYECHPCRGTGFEPGVQWAERPKRGRDL